MEFKTTNTTLKFGNYDVHLTIVENLDELFDDLIKKGEEHEDFKDERIPYWAELWASAIAMSEYLVENALITEGVTVTEMGCGLGLPSIVAGKLGAEVTMTDYLDDALDFAKLNWNNNFTNKKATFSRLDWRNPDVSLAADVLLASDVAYEKRAFEPLLKAFKTMTRPNGKIIVTEPNRYVSKNFFLNLNTEGYVVRHSTKTVETRGHPFLINIYELAARF